MSRKWICVLLGAAVAVLALSVSVRYLNRNTKLPPEEQKGTEFVELHPEETGQYQVAVSGEFPEEAAPDGEQYEFLLKNHDNYVAVYRLPENLIYEYTDIILDVLPEELKEEIEKGKYLKNEAELYNFLENYTS